MEPSLLSLIATNLSQSPDADTLDLVFKAILRQAGGISGFTSGVPPLFRKAFDEVIDSARTNRFILAELEKTEKTYIGTKVEILFRAFLKLPKGKLLDLVLDGVEVDIKFTVGQNWMIPEEAYGHPCLLLRCDERTGFCSVGLLVIRKELLNVGLNKDKKATISKIGMTHVRWFLKDCPYPKNFWEVLDPKTREEIMEPDGGTERMVRLFRCVQRQPIPRNVIEAVAQQDDPTRRIRKGGGARDKLSKEGLAILSGENDRKEIAALGLPFCTEDEFISISSSLPEEVELLRKMGRIT